MKPCLLFDSDGTLVDSEFLNCEAMSVELRASGIKEDPNTLFETYSGWQFSAVLDDLQLRHNESLDEGFTARFRYRASQHFEGRLRAVADIPEVLSELDHPKCVASNAPMAKLKQALRITGLAAYFGDRVYSAYDINSWKPQPELFLHAAREMGFSPSQCVVIEDSKVGVSAALAAGILVVHYDPNGETDIVSGVVKIRSMTELPRVLDGLG